MITLFPKFTAALPPGLGSGAGVDPLPGDGPRFADLLGAGMQEPTAASETPLPPQGASPTTPIPVRIASESGPAFQSRIDGGPAHVLAPFEPSVEDDLARSRQAQVTSAKMFDADGMLGHAIAAPALSIPVLGMQTGLSAPALARVDEASTAAQSTASNAQDETPVNGIEASDPIATERAPHLLHGATFLPIEINSAPTVAVSIPAETPAVEAPEPILRASAAASRPAAQGTRSPFAVALHAVEQGMVVAVQVDALGTDERARLRDAIAATLSRHGLTGRIAIAGTVRPDRAG